MASSVQTGEYEQLAQHQCVTASEIVRHFGVWQDRAHDHPIYIVQNGQPDLVLGSVDMMQNGGDGAEPGVAPALAADDLLDLFSETVFLLDEALRISKSNASARRYFGCSEVALRGKTLAQALPKPFGTCLDQVAERVARCGSTECVEIELESGLERALAVTIAPVGGGLALVGENIAIREQRDRAVASLGALDSALAAMRGIAEVRINARGFVDAPTESFTAFIGHDAEMVRSVRFASLFDMGSRAGVNEAIETVFREAKSIGIAADLLADGTQTVPVRLGLAPLRRNLAVVGVKVVIALENLSGSGKPNAS
ncbi:PAS domain-containing protein [Stakelama marina]|uniref:PAS domain-containing protein n=1 Tax=Stakelama marina TaxID=2826939 RepID=A0A8T4IGU1_9SPHN|nr:PAS domain-containing protein [Stakelama marina]MBR0551489.1 PAS domain-containing protein [Stakelama marina]